MQSDVVRRSKARDSGEEAQRELALPELHGEERQGRSVEVEVEPPAWNFRIGQELIQKLLRLRVAGAQVVAAASSLLAWERGGWALAQSFGAAQWTAVAFIGLVGGALAFYLWVYALEHTTPTRVANTMTINPLAASLLAAVLVGEPLGVNLAVGIAAVALGIWLASSAPR